MADDAQTTGVAPGLVQEFAAQLGRVTAALESLTGMRERIPSIPAGLPLPGALSAAQLTSITSSIAAQRRSIQALQAQLSAFDEQLAVLERILGPLTAWSGTWADLEKRLLNLGLGQEGKGKSDAS